MLDPKSNARFMWYFSDNSRIIFLSISLIMGKLYHFIELFAFYFSSNVWFQRLRDLIAQSLINSTNFDAAQNLEITQDPRNPLQTIVELSR